MHHGRGYRLAGGLTAGVTRWWAGPVESSRTEKLDTQSCLNEAAILRWEDQKLLGEK
ncbi:MAG TPA: hypothetical protein VFC02_23660 [Anaerolineales bacterium]|nr:hypothetical protein [Anaerolineales bacterium]